MNLTELQIEDRLRYVHTMLIGRVSKADNAKQTVDVQILTKRVYRSTEGVVSRAIDVLPDVPVAGFRTDRGGDFVELLPGDLVLVLFAMHDASEIVTSDGDCGVIAPTLVETHGLGSGFAIPFSLKDRPATSAGAKREIISDDLQLGRPNASHAVVLEGLQTVLDNFAALMYDALVDAAGNIPPALPADIFFGTIPTSSHVKVS